MTLGFDRPVIYLITPGEATEANFSQARERILRTVEVAVSEQITLIQIREKRLSIKRLFELSESVVRETHGSQTRVLINGRADVALAVGAAGVHLTAMCPPVAAVRASEMLAAQSGFLIGVSTHSLGEVRKASAAGADFAVYGPVFESPGKAQPIGVENLSAVCEATDDFPVLGLGGIDATNLAAILASGARGIAAIRALNDPDSLRLIASRLREYSS